MAGWLGSWLMVAQILEGYDSWLSVGMKVSTLAVVLLVLWPQLRCFARDLSLKISAFELTLPVL